MRSSPPTNFDDRQLAAIDHVHGPILVVAGAGTGKTLVLTQRIARLISEGHAQPDQILAVTYTENAAQELRQRVEKISGKTAANLRATTFHGYCFGLLHRHGRGFKVVDRPDLWVFLRRRMAELDLRQFIKAANPAEFLDDLLVFFERCQDELVTPADYQAYLQRVRSGELPIPRVAKSKHMAELRRDDALARCEEIARVFATVERMLKERGLGTFGHMIVHAVELLRRDPELLAQERKQARFILIDEFQDSNLGQIELARLLAGDEQNIFAVGDPDQAIYRFRGATSGAFDEFLRRFPAAQLVALERNHRSRANILNCAYATISRNPPIVRPGNSGGLKFDRRPLHAVREQSFGDSDSSRALQVRVVVSPAAETEAGDIADSIQQLRRLRRTRWKEFAVLYRSHRHRDRLAQELAEREIPFVVSGLDVLETTPVRDLLALLRVATGRDDASSWLRVAAQPVFHIDPEVLRQAFVDAGRGCKAAEVIKGVAGGAPVIEAVEQVRRQIVPRTLTVSEIIALVTHRFELDGAEPSLKTFCDFAAQWQKKPTTERGDLTELLEYLDFFTAGGGTVALPDPSDDTDAVRLLTAHSAKGLEFEHVFVIRLNASSFPAYYREPFFAFPDQLRHWGIESRDEKVQHLEEERRLLYVAMTRAKDSLGLYAKPGFGRDSTPSGFLRELVKDKNVTGMLTYHAARPQQIDLPVPVPPESISAVAPWVLMPAREALQKLTLSATAIEAYERCPLQFKMAHDWRLPGEAVAAMHFGSAMHTALKRFFDAERSGKRPAVGDAIQMFEEALQATAVDDPLQRELYRQQGIKQLHAFVEAVEAGKPLEVLDTERSFRVEVGGTMVTGRVDRLDAIGSEGEVAITDYKTGSPRSQDDADKSLQLSLYALAAKRAWNVDPQVLIFYNLETNAAIRTARSAEELRAAEERVREVAADIAAGHFDPTPAVMKCRYCAYRSLCPATEQKLYTIEHMAYAAAKTS